MKRYFLILMLVLYTVLAFGQSSTTTTVTTAASKPKPVQYLLLDKFSDTLAAGAVNNSKSTSGATRTIKDGNSKLNVGSGTLRFLTGGAGENDPGITYGSSAMTRKAGQMLFGTLTPSGTSASLGLGWTGAKNGALSNGIFLWNSGALYIRQTTGTTVVVGAYSAQSLNALAVQRTTGEFEFSQVPSASWRLLWMNNVATGNAYPSVLAMTTTAVATADNLAIPQTLWLPTPLGSDGFTPASSTWIANVVNDTTNNGGFETWTSGTDLALWEETVNGTSSITQTVNKHSGQYALQFLVDGSNSYVSIYKASLLTSGKTYRFRCWIKNLSGSLKQIAIGTPFIEKSLPADTLWHQWDTTFIATTATTFEIKRDGASTTAVLDDFVLEEIQLGSTDGLGHAEGIAGGLGSGGGSKSYTQSGTWGLSLNKAVNTPTLTGSELQANGTFESFATGDTLPSSWGRYPSGSYHTAKETTTKHGGSSSLLMQTSTGGRIELTGGISGVIGRWVEYSGWVYPVVGNIRIGNTNSTILAFSVTSATATSAWAKLTATSRVISAGGDGAMEFDLGTGIRTVYVDDASAKQLSLPILFSSIETSTNDVVASVDATVSAGTQAGMVLNLDNATYPQNFVIAYHDGVNARLEKCVGPVVTNGGFETNWTGWVKGSEDAHNVYTLDADHQAGTTAAKLVTDGIGDSYLSQNDFVVAGHSYQIRMWYKNSGGALHFWMGADYTVASSAAWRYLDTTLTAVSAAFSIDPVGSGTFFFDGFSVTDLDGGTYTTVITAAATYSAGAPLVVIKDGTSYSLFYNNAKVGSTTAISDAGIISNTKHGLFSTSNLNTLDNLIIYPRGTNGEYDKILNKLMPH